MRRRAYSGGMSFTIQACDITTLSTDVIVNAANSTLLGGGGVDGAIHRAAGPKLLEACQGLRLSSLPDGLPIGRAVATAAFDLPATWVIHTVGPNRHRGQTDPEDLAACFSNSLLVAGGMGLRSIAFPAIGAGVYGWDMHTCATVACRALAATWPAVPCVREVTVALFDEANVAMWEEAAHAAALL